MLRDLRYALRALRGAPAFAITVVLTLGIGLGLNTTLFTLFNAYVLRPFAVRDPYSLYGLRWATARYANRAGITWEQYQDLRIHVPLFSDATAFSPFLARVESRNLQGLAVAGNYFSMLGVGAERGRPILPEDSSSPGAGAVVVLSHQVWASAFGSDPSIVGHTIRIAGRPFEVIGVGPPDFIGIAEFPVDFFIPLTMVSAVGPDLFGPQKPSAALVIGRVPPEIPLNNVQAALTVWIRHATEQAPETERAIQASLTPRATPVALEPEILTVFLPLIVVFGLVLLICCVNVSNMMLARALARQREIGVRLAMGAARSRLVRQLLSENFLLSLLAGAVGFAVSLGAIRGAQRILTATIPPSLNLLHTAPLEPDYRVFLFILGAAALSTILFGLAPALQATRTSLVEALRGEFGARVSSSRLRSILVVGQISACMILLVLTGILLRGSAAYQRMDLGYNIHGIVYPFFIGRTDPTTSVKAAQRLLAEPWVDVLAAAWNPPLRSVIQMPIATTGSTQSIRAAYNMVSPEYFAVLGIPILRGRNFGKVESESESAVAIVSQATAQKFWPNEDALGKSILLDKKLSAAADAPRFDQAVVIGIAKDITSGTLISGRDATMIYFPTHADAKRAMTFLIRGKDNVPADIRRLELALAASVPDRPVLAISMDEMFVTQAYPFRAGAYISALLGGLALLLTLSGMYGVLSYLVGQRTKEIGIRMALGATPGMVVRLVLSQSMKFAMWGVAAGLALAFAGALLLWHLLTMINAFDAVAYASGAAIVMLASLAAAFFPSSRAARINPVETLRAD
jgi:predicted permease